MIRSLNEIAVLCMSLSNGDFGRCTRQEKWQENRENEKKGKKRNAMKIKVFMESKVKYFGNKIIK